jgi:hypothetical protein
MALLCPNSLRDSSSCKVSHPYPLRLNFLKSNRGHLYRHHRIFPCQRCKTLFNDQQEVNDHLKEPKGCELLEVVQHDGITNEIVEKLRSKKKAHRDQSEEDRWKEIYQILFPGEMVPSPCKLYEARIILQHHLEMHIFKSLNCHKIQLVKANTNLVFEEIQEDVIQSPDSQELTDYEEYCRRELPRVFRASLEEVVTNSTQPLEEQLRSQLMDLIRDAQDRVFASYRSSSTTTGTPVRGAPSSSPQTITSSSTLQGFSTSPLSLPSIGSGDRSRARLLDYFQPPSPQSHLESGLDISVRNITPSKPDRNNRSDSGYDGSPFALPPTLPLTPSDSTAYASTLIIQTSPVSEVNQNNFNFDSDTVNISNFDVCDFGNYNFPQGLDESYSPDSIFK